MRKCFSRYLIFLLLITGSDSYSQWFNFRHYTVEDGIPQSEIKAVYQDRRGFIWMGTAGGGISRFDGTSFVSYSVKEGLASVDIFNFAEDKNGKLWIATDGGISVFDGKKFINYTDSNNLPSTGVYSVFHDREGNTWAGTQKGLCRFIPGSKKGKEFQHYPFLKGGEFDSIMCITQDVNGNIFLGTTAGLRIFRYNPAQPGKLEYKKIMGKADSLAGADVRSVCFDKFNRVLVGCMGGISIIKNVLSAKPTIRNIRTRDGLPSGSIYSIIMDRQGVIWAGTYSGIAKIRRDDTKKEGYSFEIITRREGLPDDICESILEDREGNIWIGGYNGAAVFSSSRFTVYSEKNGLPYNTVWAVKGDDDGNIWVGTDTAIAHILLNPNDYDKYKKRIFSFTKRDGLAGSWATAIFQDSKGNVWFGHSRMLSMLPAAEIKNPKPRFKTFTKENGFNGGLVSGFVEDEKGVLWISTFNGLLKYENNVFTKFTTKDGMINHKLVDIIQDRKGNFWIASEGGLIKYDGLRFLNFTRNDGMTTNDIVTVREDYDGNIWIATHDAGIMMYDGYKFTAFNEDHGMKSNTVFCMILDNDDNVWAGSNKGVDKLDYQKYKKEGKKELKHFGKDEGFLGIECNQNAAYMDLNGNLWFGTVKGVIIYNPREDKINTIPPVTHITGIKLFLKEADWAPYSASMDPLTLLPRELELPYDKNSITFDFLGLSYNIPDQVKYQYMLEGLDNEWSPVVRESYAHYTNLPPGTYNFKVKACNNDNVWNEIPTEFRFKIHPPFWKTWWFYTICIVTALSALVYFIKWRERSLKYQQKLLERQVAQRTLQLKEEKEKVELAYQEIGAKNKEITDSIRYAKNLQEAILPPDEEVRKILPESFILYKPKDIVSGDFYWVEKTKDRVLFAAVDCTGHGVPGAFMSIVGNNLLNQAVRERFKTKPGDILNELNSGIGQALRQSRDESLVKDGMDIALCSLDMNTLNLEFSGANNPLWIIRKNHNTHAIPGYPAVSELMSNLESIPTDSLEEIKGDKQPIGKFLNERAKDFTNHSVRLGKGDMVYVFSDGFADQFGGKEGKKFKYKQLKKLLVSIHHKALEEQRETLEKIIESWRGNLEQVDDILILGIRV